LPVAYSSSRAGRPDVRPVDRDHRGGSRSIIPDLDALKIEGDAFTLFSAEEIGYVASIERLIGQTIERRKLENFPYKFTTVLDNEARAKAIMFGRKKKKGRR